LSPEAAMKMVQDGKAVLVDVRPRNLYEKGHCEGAVSVPLYQVRIWSVAGLIMTDSQITKTEFDMHAF